MSASPRKRIPLDWLDPARILKVWGPYWAQFDIQEGDIFLPADQRRARVFLPPPSEPADIIEDDSWLEKKGVALLNWFSILKKGKVTGLFDEMAAWEVSPEDTRKILYMRCHGFLDQFLV